MYAGPHIIFSVMWHVPGKHPIPLNLFRNCAQRSLMLQISDGEAVLGCEMLLEFKDDNTTGSFLLHHLFYVLDMITVSDCECTRVQIYTINLCTDGMVMDMCLCLLLVVICVLCCWLGISHL